MTSRKGRAARQPERRAEVRPAARRRWGALWASAGTIVLASIAAALVVRETRNAGSPPDAATPLPAAQHVGSEQCGSCHSAEHALWQRSQHRAAMATADAQTVRGDFSNARFDYAGTTSHFFRRDGKYFVRTDGPEGRLADYEVKYTFGVEPLQQYLVELAGGRLQALSIAWDTRPRAAGGQRWFHLYPNERIRSDDELHWTRPSQNWNDRCADCHSTALRKNFDAASNAYQTRWSEISVGCEACHGPGSRHLTWARSDGQHRAADSTRGLAVRFAERRGVRWTVSAATGNATRSAPRTTEREMESCAQCHSRRGQLVDGYEPGKSFYDYYRPATLTRPLYHVDGQQREEVYTWGSFLQSRMYAKGVTCSDCHEPHGGKVRAPGNALCATCHLAAKYDATAHHRHLPASAGASCTSCHMPTTTYMVVDPRHDHSLRVPRPDLTVTLGTPNACTSCHAERGAQWATDQVRRWYGRDAGGHQRFAGSFAAADADRPAGQAQLVAIARDGEQPAIARATALANVNPMASADAFAALRGNRRASEPVLRLAALEAAALLPEAQRVELAAPLLADSLRAVRIAAARLLASTSTALMDSPHRRDFQRAAAEFIAMQRRNADRADAHASLGTLLAQVGDLEGGASELQAALRLDPRFVLAYVNLADVYRELGRDEEGARQLRDALTRMPRSGALYHSLGLALTRLQRRDSALAAFSRAATLEPTNARFAYVHAVALHSAGKVDAAVATLQRALSSHPADGDILNALSRFLRARGDTALATRYADRLRLLASGR